VVTRTEGERPSLLADESGRRRDSRFDVARRIREALRKIAKMPSLHEVVNRPTIVASRTRFSIGQSQDTKKGEATPIADPPRTGNAVISWYEVMFFGVPLHKRNHSLIPGE